jgi:hypothetical protein
MQPRKCDYKDCSCMLPNRPETLGVLGTTLFFCSQECRQLLIDFLHESIQSITKEMREKEND